MPFRGSERQLNPKANLADGVKAVDAMADIRSDDKA